MEEHRFCANCGHTLQVPHERQITGGKLVVEGDIFYVMTETKCHRCYSIGYTIAAGYTDEGYAKDQVARIKAHVAKQRMPSVQPDTTHHESEDN